MAANPAVSIMVLSYRNYRHVRDCVDSVLASTCKDFKVYIVDNNSEKAVIEAIRERYGSRPEVEIVENSENLGYAEGNNVGIRLARSEFIVLLNNDTTVEPGWLEPLLEKMKSDPKIAACQPKLLNMEDRSTFDYSGAAGGYIDRYGYPFLRGRLLDTVERDEGQYDSDVLLDWCSGAAFMVRRSALDEVGFFDPLLFMYGEENDLCWRLKKCGYKIAFVHRSVVYHAGRGSTRKRPIYRLHMNYRNGLILLLKNLRAGELLTILPVRVLLDLLNIFYFLIFKTFQFPYLSILWAYWEIAVLAPKIAASRSRTQALYKKRGVSAIRYQTYDISLIYRYFALGRTKFSSLGL